MTKRIALTDDETKAIRMAAHAVWNYIAYDVMMMVKEQDGKDTIPRDHVLELVCDANRLEQEIRKTNASLASKVGAMPYTQLLAVLRPAFPYARYE